MSMADAGTCLSDLSDDLLRHILFFAPAKEAASTSVLSRRWRSLWRTSGAVNLDSRSFNRDGCPDQAFLAAADKALAAAQCTVRKLTLYVERSVSSSSDHNLVAAVVSHKRARRVEELRIDIRDENTRCTLSFGSLPSKALRVLRIVNVCPPTAAAAADGFPRLEDLHLQGCTFSFVDLQRTIDAAPQLSQLHLRSCAFREESMDYWKSRGGKRYRLHCPKLTHLVFSDCTSLWDNEVDLNLVNDHRSSSQGPVGRQKFWEFLQSFNTAKILKLRIDLAMGGIDDDDEEGSQQGDQLTTAFFSHLERLELEAKYNRESKTTPLLAIVLGNLLGCFPRVSDLRLRLINGSSPRWTPSDVDDEARLEFDESVDGFRRRKRPRISSGGGEDGDDSTYNQAFDIIPGLSDLHSFTCLRRVSLRFCMDDTNCLGVQLAKFFADKATLLEEMYIDDGSQKLHEHSNHSVRRWIANSSKRRRSSEDVAVLPQ
ncbi:hypothetical protein U9M48_001404 [Paspalum notatum var. saurae]|uniref:F-box domain-containing protein n=1 Tax=Paspalum notatum var. saurae TaxID=547442 RepID=A0AAQ3SGN6_PASNO